jgi:hypothetical protein
MNNLLSYCGLVDAKIRAFDIDLPVKELASYHPKLFESIKLLSLGTEIMATDHYIEAAAATVADSSATYFHQSGGATYREERR